MLDRLIPQRARDTFWRLCQAPERRNFQRSLQRLNHVPRRDVPALSYGAVLGTEEQGVVHGGRVKLLHLAEDFPECADFNLLYLVSSAPPKFAADLVEWARPRGVKLVWNQNGVGYPAWAGSRSDDLNEPMRALHAQADFIFYQSEFCRACAERFLGPAQAPDEIAFNCVDTTHFTPESPPDTGACHLLAAGSHHEPYRVFSVLETVAELARRKFPAELHLTGRLMWDDAEAAVEEKIRALGIGDRVRRGRAYRQEEAPAIFRAAHILLHPKYKDPCPTVPIEAMACGVPVIGSASGGMPELVPDEAGVLIDVPESWEENHWPTATAMADAVEKIMGRWPEYHAAARAHAEARFSKDDWMAQHWRVFHSLVTI